MSDFSFDEIGQSRSADDKSDYYATAQAHCSSLMSRPGFKWAVCLGLGFWAAVGLIVWYA